MSKNVVAALPKSTPRPALLGVYLRHPSFLLLLPSRLDFLNCLPQSLQGLEMGFGEELRDSLGGGDGRGGMSTLPGYPVIFPLDVHLFCFVAGWKRGGRVIWGAAVSPLYRVSTPPPPGCRKSKVKLLSHDRALVCPSFLSSPTRKVE